MNLLRRRDDEAGAALVLALLGVLILAGLAVVFVNRATTETRAASFSQDFESAIHVVEDAADRRIATVADDPEHVTHDASGDEIQLDGTLTTTDEEAAWAAGLVDRMDGSDGWVESQEGEAFAVRPRSDELNEDGDYPPAGVIYAVSAVPGFDAERSRVRVLKLQIEQASFVPEFAFLTNAAFDFGGNAEIISPGCDTSDAQTAEETCIADVHTNQGYTQSGSSSTIEGKITTSEETCPGSTAAELGCEAGVDERDVPAIEARDYYDSPVATDPEGQEVDWRDLCSDGTVREWSSAGPCTGDLVWDGTGGGNTSYRGWKWQAGGWRGGSVQAGIFYVHHADARIQGSDGDTPRTVTVMVEQDPANPGGSGSLDIQGNPQMQAAYPGLLFLTDADLEMQGTATAGSCGDNPPAYSGLMAVGEQFDSSGTVELRGSIIVQDRADEHGLVQRNNASVGGTMCLEFDDDLSFDLLGQWVVSFWNEL